MDILTSSALMGLHSQISAARFEVTNLNIQNQTLNIRIRTLMNEINTLKTTINNHITKENMLTMQIRNYENLLAKNQIEYSNYKKEIETSKTNQSSTQFDYEKLLEQPLHVIAHKHKKFRENWIKEQELLAGWMVSQRAFKELAIEYGEQLGINCEETINNGVDKKLGVLNNEFKPEHQTNYSELNLESHLGQSDSDKIAINLINETKTRLKK